MVYSWRPLPSQYYLFQLLRALEQPRRAPESFLLDCWQLNLILEFDWPPRPSDRIVGRIFDMFFYIFLFCQGRRDRKSTISCFSFSSFRNFLFKIYYLLFLRFIFFIFSKLFLLFSKFYKEKKIIKKYIYGPAALLLS